MKRNAQWRTGIGTAAIIASAAVAWATPQGPGEMRPEGPGQGQGGEIRQGAMPMQGQRPMMGPAERLKELGATEQQIQALKQVSYEQDKQMVTLRANVERAEIELRHLMDAASVDKKAITETLDVLGAARAELFKAETLNMLKIREALGEKLFNLMRQSTQRQGGPGGQGGSMDRPQPPQLPAAGMQGRGEPDQAGAEPGGPGER